MPPRLFIDSPLGPDQVLELPPNASRHVQVLRLQPGDALCLFDGLGGQWQAEVSAIGRRSVSARVHAHQAQERELAVAITLATAMPANDRMDTLVEKATELGAAAIRPLVSARSVLRLDGERAERKARHWQSVAQAACEQCGRNRVPHIATPTRLAEAWGEWSDAADAAAGAWTGRRLVLSLSPQAQPLSAWLHHNPAPTRLVLLSGPEGGLTEAEEAEALHRGFEAVSLGARVLRADTAPLAALAVLATLMAPVAHPLAPTSPR